MSLLTGRENQTYMGKNVATGNSYFYQKINILAIFQSYPAQMCRLGTNGIINRMKKNHQQKVVEKVH
jgi:hypothetical protein